MVIAGLQARATALTITAVAAGCNMCVLSKPEFGSRRYCRGRRRPDLLLTAQSTVPAASSTAHRLAFSSFRRGYLFVAGQFRPAPATYSPGWEGYGQTSGSRPWWPTGIALSAAALSHWSGTPASPERPWLPPAILPRRHSGTSPGPRILDRNRYRGELGASLSTASSFRVPACFNFSFPRRRSSTWALWAAVCSGFRSAWRSGRSARSSSPGRRRRLLFDYFRGTGRCTLRAHSQQSNAGRPRAVPWRDPLMFLTGAYFIHHPAGDLTDPARYPYSVPNKDHHIGRRFSSYLGGHSCC